MTAARARPRGRPEGGGAGELLALIRAGLAATKAELGARSGQARPTVAKHVARLLKSQLIVAEGARVSTAGRPAEHYAFNPAAGAVLACDLGLTGAHLALTDLAGRTVVDEERTVDVRRGPERTVAWVADRLAALLARAALPKSKLRGIGLGLPGAVDPVTGRVLDTPRLPGWADADVTTVLAERFGVDVVTDGGVNLMAWAEQATLRERPASLLFVKVATTIGCAFVIDGRLYRGVHGAAGDLGHVPVAGADGRACGCGNHGCLETIAGGEALARSLTERGVRAENGRDVVRLLGEGHPEAARIVREAGRHVGEALATLIGVLAPALVAVGGDYVGAGDQLITGIREVVYRRALPATTRALQVAPSVLAGDAGVRGAALRAIDHVLEPARVDTRMALRPR